MFHKEIYKQKVKITGDNKVKLSDKVILSVLENYKCMYEY